MESKIANSASPTLCLRAPLGHEFPCLDACRCLCFPQVAQRSQNLSAGTSPLRGDLWRAHWEEGCGAERGQKWGGQGAPGQKRVEGVGKGSPTLRRHCQHGQRGRMVHSPGSLRVPQDSEHKNPSLGFKVTV